MPERRQQLLVVEDDLDLAEMLKAYFNVQGFDVLTAAWGKEAVEKAHDQVPSLVVLDIRLPDIDGFEVCRQLRSSRKTQDIPIIFLTEKRDRVDKLQGLELGVVDYITKPFDIQELRLRVRNTLYRAAAKSIENPVTGLPEGEALDERLAHLLKETPDWAMLIVVLRGMDSFRDLYGFIASDDVLRAISLMIANAVTEASSESGFIGHLDQHDFLLLTAPDHVQALHDRIVERIGQSLDYFYPRDNRGPKAHPGGDRLAIALARLTPADGPFSSAEALKQAALKARKDLLA